MRTAQTQRVALDCRVTLLGRGPPRPLQRLHSMLGRVEPPGVTRAVETCFTGDNVRVIRAQRNSPARLTLDNVRQRPRSCGRAGNVRTPHARAVRAHAGDGSSLHTHRERPIVQQCAASSRSTCCGLTASDLTVNAAGATFSLRAVMPVASAPGQWMCRHYRVGQERGTNAGSLRAPHARHDACY